MASKQIHLLFRLVFAGAGHAVKALVDYTEQHRLGNVIFTGKYLKADEEIIVKSHQMINSYLGNDINSDTLMSNRFYLSVQMRKPIIVKGGTYQADVVERYGLGVVILNPGNNYSDRIVEYWKTFDWKLYDTNCKRNLNDILKDLEQFNNLLISLYSIQWK